MSLKTLLKELFFILSVLIQFEKFLFRTTLVPSNYIQCVLVFVVALFCEFKYELTS